MFFMAGRPPHICRIYDPVVQGPAVTFPATTPRANDPPGVVFFPPPSSSMYKNLRTNLPTSIMAIPDFPFPDDIVGRRNSDQRVFPGHASVLEYLRLFARHFDLEKHIRLKTAVTNVVKHQSSCDLGDSAKRRWSLTLHDVETNRVWNETADAVVVCNGHFSAPYIPAIKGLAEYAASQRNVEHSKSYRTPEEFSGKRVLIVGGASSAIDIARDVVSVAREVTQSVRTPGGSADIGEPVGTTREPYHSIRVKPQIAEMNPETGDIVFEDGTSISRPDRVIFATGYLFSFPFLDWLQRDDAIGAVDGLRTHVTPRDDEVLITDGLCVHNLWKQIFYMKDPTLSFIGLPLMVVPFELFDYQAQVVALYLIGKLKLPPEINMRAQQSGADFMGLPSICPEDSSGGKNGKRLSGTSGNRAHHVLGLQQYEYCNRLAEFAGLPPVHPWRIEERIITRELRKESLGY